MDIWEPAPQRHKRSFREMSHPATLSPSPINFGDPAASSFFSTSRLTPSDNLPSFFERRRTSHPHNQHSQRASEEMPDRIQPHQRPRLEHRASQTVIDLTDDPEDSPAPPRHNAGHPRSHRPPQLGRSDAINLGDLIDLTDDSGDAEITITGERRLPIPRPRSRLRLPMPTIPRADGADSPPLFVPPVPRPHGHNQAVINSRHSIGAIIGGRSDLRAALGHANFPMFNMMGHDFMNQLHQHIENGPHQAMPNGLNYGHAAWANQKPEHIPPPTARENFTRSPTEDDVVICPSCEQELVQTKDVEEPVVKKSGKAPTRKEREEHPFWVVKECGHVYCNSCYQLRTQASKHSQVNFRDPTSKTSIKKKTLLCAVEDCEADVRTKEKWVGVFL